MGKEKVEQTQHDENTELEEKLTPHVNYLRQIYLHRQWINAMAHKIQKSVRQWDCKHTPWW